MSSSTERMLKNMPPAADKRLDSEVNMAMPEEHCSESGKEYPQNVPANKPSPTMAMSEILNNCLKPGKKNERKVPQ